MKKQSLNGFVLVVFILISVSVSAQRGTVDCTSTLESKILKREMHYSVFLPASYHSSNRAYPVLYLLHGMWDDYTAWTTKGEVQHIASKLMASGDVPEAIIIMPDGLLDGFYVNNFDGSVKWTDFFHEEFIPHIEGKYRILNDRSKRAIAGLSMGGYGALYQMITHEEKFGACYAMSAALLQVTAFEAEKQNSFNKDFNLKIWGPDNKEGFPENYKKYAVQEIVKSMEVYNASERTHWSPKKPFPKTCIDCGDDDFLLNENMDLVRLMKDKQIPFEFRVREGAHNWSYWRSGLELALVFVGDVFRE